MGNYQYKKLVNNLRKGKNNLHETEKSEEIMEKEMEIGIREVRGELKIQIII